MSNDNEETMVNDTTETVEQYLASLTPEEKDYNLSIFFLLRSNERFLDFIDANFTIGQKIDHETKTVALVVAEKPVERPTFLVSDEMAAKIGAMLRQVHKVSNPASCLLNILDIINGKVVDESSLIVATEGDMQKELALQKLMKGNLD